MLELMGEKENRLVKRLLDQILFDRPKPLFFKNNKERYYVLNLIDQFQRCYKIQNGANLSKYYCAEAFTKLNDIYNLTDGGIWNEDS